MFRGKNVNRLEALSDAVFAVSTTLLVVSMEVPDNVPDLLNSLGGFLGFAFSFAMLILIWREHHRFFRLFGLEDGTTIFLNSILLFVVLFYVYPLKFLASTLGNLFLDENTVVINSMQEMQHLFMVYSGGWIAVFLSLAAMYWHAGRKKSGLEQSERKLARLWMKGFIMNASVGLLSFLLAWIGIGVLIGLPGWVFGLLWATNLWQAKQITRHKKQCATTIGETREE